MLNFGEFPKDVEESGLSQILEENAPPKYYLSARACEGVLRRAERRGKELPEIRKTALQQQIKRGNINSPVEYSFTDKVVCYDFSEERRRTVQQYNDLSPCLSARCGTGGNNTPVVCYDARGNGDGKVCPTITGDHNDRVTDYTAICVSSGFLPFAGAKANGIGYAEEQAPTLRAESPTACVATACVVCYSQAAHDKYTQTENVATLKETGGTYGGGSESLICYCLQGNGIDRADTAGCNGKGVKENESYTLNTVDSPVVCAKEEQIYIVRRLTPIECARLQGMPDWWCADVPHSDSAEYKLWGNGMALPNALYIMEGFIDETNS